MTRIQHSDAVRVAHPRLVAATIRVDGITAAPDVREQVRPYADTARRRLGEQPVSGFPEIRAWRRAFAEMGLKPTQYRCAAEALLRRLNTAGDLPRIHPLVDLCNHLSVAFATPVAALDLARITGDIDVRPATGDERYLAFSGEVEHPAPGEIIFADAGGNAHARRWTNRQSALSAISDPTTDAIIVVEALHPDAERDIAALTTDLARELRRTWRTEPVVEVITRP